mmetsp:Transcript_30362/g.72409  ORF Transcript_30362/g.72409 Transcript_30362/m.72409 type:complete len:236 (-) Transcript_30362:82-789(-)
MDLQVQAPTLVMIKAAGAHPAAVHADKKPVSAIAAIIVHTICIIPRARIAFIRLRYQNAFGVGIAVADMDSSHGVIHGSAVRGLALQLQVHAPASVVIVASGTNPLARAVNPEVVVDNLKAHPQVFVPRIVFAAYGLIGKHAFCSSATGADGNNHAEVRVVHPACDFQVHGPTMLVMYCVFASDAQGSRSDGVKQCGPPNPDLVIGIAPVLVDTIAFPARVSFAVDARESPAALV